MFELITPPSSSLFPGSFSKRFQYAEDIERQHVVKMSKLAGKERTRIHLLSDHKGNCYGFVALSFSSFDRNFNRTSIIIDYVFTSYQYRGQIFTELNTMKVFEYLLGVVFQSAVTIQKILPVRFIALQPATERLAEYYRKIDFKSVEGSDWMFLSI